MESFIDLLERGLERRRKIKRLRETAELWRKAATQLAEQPHPDKHGNPFSQQGCMRNSARLDTEALEEIRA